jgi:hypothetical protein
MDVKTIRIPEEIKSIIRKLGNDLNGDIFALTKREEVDVIRQRFGIVGADTAGKYNVLQIMTVLAVQRDSRQIHHIQNVGISHFVADGKGDHIEILDRILAFQRP